jgi:YaiO family outer membrane protein
VKHSAEARALTHPCTLPASGPIDGRRTGHRPKAMGQGTLQKAKGKRHMALQWGAWSVVAVLLLAPGPASAQARPSEVVLREARAAVHDGHPAEAMRLLETHLKTSARDVDARLLYGLVLSWSGLYDDARRELERVLAQAPGYTDARVALANVEWWSHQYDRLHKVAGDGRRRDPEDARWLVYEARALEGLGRPADARQAVGLALARQPGNVQARALGERLDAQLRPWSTQFTQTFDWFDDNRATWQESALTIGRQTPIGTVLARTSYAERFGFSDTQFEIEAYPRIRPGTYGYVNVGGSVDRALYPRSRVGLELYQSLGRGFEASAGWRRLDFSTDTNIYVGTLTKYAGQWMLTGRAFYVPGELKDSSSYYGVARRYFGADGTSFWGLSYGHGFSREEIRNASDLFLADADTLRGEFDLRLGRRLRAAASGSTSRQERMFGPLRQHTFSGSLRVEF